MGVGNYVCASQTHHQAKLEEEELNNKNPPTPCLWQAPASTQKTKRENQAGHSSERTVEGRTPCKPTHAVPSLPSLISSLSYPARLSSLVVNATTSHLAVMGSIPNWAITTSSAADWRRGVQKRLGRCRDKAGNLMPGWGPTPS